IKNIKYKKNKIKKIIKNKNKIKKILKKKVAEVAIEQFAVIWKNLGEKKEEILSVLEEEETKFNSTLAQGLKEVEKMVLQISSGVFNNSNGESFKLYETHGFPPEMLIEELQNNGVKVNEDLFWKNHNKAFEEHQDKSRTAAKGLFKGGLADTSEKSKRLHTATHLLLAALYKVLGDHVYQKGSNITPERLRLDFPNDAKLTDEQIKQVEDLVNEQIEKGLPISWEEMSKEEALKKVPYAAFEDRYQDVLKVYTIGGEKPFSVEICMGPHVENTKELGRFRIIKQENVGAGIKRIKAVLE
ncbi:alanine--tRNA ligase, partial [Candidatus Dojkabacteria bacterium]|nr:alanine--tRNA ligase [Candidatus Dojkabacteria bacterium]